MADLAASSASIHDGWATVAPAGSDRPGVRPRREDALREGWIIGEALALDTAALGLADEPRWSRRRSLALVVGVSFALWGVIVGGVLLL